MAVLRSNDTVQSRRDRDFEPIDLAFTPAPWTEQAACRFIGPEPFFPGPGRGRGARAAAETAKAICAGCAVSAECLDFAMTTELDSRRYGIYAGLTPDDRHELHQRQTQEATA